MLSIALTGGIGSGKSLAAEFFEELGAVVIDSDQLARDAIERGTPGFDEVVASFGDAILSGGEIDRAKLAEIVFKDELARRNLEAIIHPRVRDIATRIAARVPQDGVVINQIPLLFETNGKSRFDVVITVASTLENRKARLAQRGMKSYEIERRINAQASDEQRASIADIVIENDGTQEELEARVAEVWEREILPRINK
ncbi:MAG: dephospho-CoA kinase [Candidatus Nanopelagicaceae bacterium]|jgi:dephospho-CoA kinase|nr:dephospho-CoA kinase [Actinomycetota bacterium]